MVRVHVISPQNEVRVVRRLASEVERLWPDVATSKTEHVDLLVGVRAEIDVDLLIAIDLTRERHFPPEGGRVQSALLAVEIKQLDAGRLAFVGNQLFADYGGGRESRSVGDQARDAAHGVKRFAARSGYPHLYVYALAWMTEMQPDQLRDADLALVAGNAGWFGLLAAAARQSDRLYAVDEPGTREGVRAVRDRMINRRQVSSLDRGKAKRVAQDVAAREIVDALAPRAGSAFIRLAGHGGSGKTTALALLAVRLAGVHGARVLILTFHRALCGDIQHVLAGMPEVHGLPADRLHVETATGFMLSLLTALVGSVPKNEAGMVDYAALDGAYEAAREKLSGGPDGDIATTLRAYDEERFDWDHVLIDEAQDWSDAERDFLAAVYGHRRIAIADGLEQLVRRQTRCDWLSGVPKAERAQRVLGDSLRMLRNVAEFANACCGRRWFCGLARDARDDLAGGRIIISLGPGMEAPGLVEAMAAAAAKGGADPVDCLICVPPSNVVRDGDGSRHAAFADAIVAAGGDVWDASDPAVRSIAPASPKTWRVVQYDSCRGLEGWLTLALDLDDLYAQKIRHPNFEVDGEGLDPAGAALRWLLMPLTRAVHTLVITIREPESPIVAMLRRASAEAPADAVRMVRPPTCAANIEEPV